MLKKSSAFAMVLLTLAACGSNPQPRIIQPSGNSPDIHLTVGMATQIELPDDGSVQSMTVGNSNLVEATQASGVISLMPKGNAGQTNLIIRARDESGTMMVYQYHLTVDPAP